MSTYEETLSVGCRESEDVTCSCPVIDGFHIKTQWLEDELHFVHAVEHYLPFVVLCLVRAVTSLNLASL